MKLETNVESPIPILHVTIPVPSSNGESLNEVRGFPQTKKYEGQLQQIRAGVLDVGNTSLIVACSTSSGERDCSSRKD